MSGEGTIFVITTAAALLFYSLGWHIPCVVAIFFVIPAFLATISK